MTFTPTQVEALKAPLGRSHVKERTQAGRKFSYVEGWWAIAEANRIFGHDMWHRETVEMRQLGDPREVDGKWRVAYMAKVRIEVFAGERCIIREGCGYGSGIDRDIGSAHESALKEAETDAMKRALMTFGNPFGLALYDKDQASVADDTAPAERQRSPAPKPSGRTPQDWGNEAIAKVRGFKTSREFDDWHRANREIVARFRDVDANMHGKLVEAISAALDRFNPVHA